MAGKITYVVEPTPSTVAQNPFFQAQILVAAVYTKHFG